MKTWIVYSAEVGNWKNPPYVKVPAMDIGSSDVRGSDGAEGHGPQERICCWPYSTVFPGPKTITDTFASVIRAPLFASKIATIR